MESSNQKVFVSAKDGIRATVRLFKTHDGHTDVEVKVEIDEVSGKFTARKKLPLIVAGEPDS